MNTTGKIARLPRDLRIKLNRRLDNGIPSHQILAWLNRDKIVRKILAEQFDSKPLNRQNLSAWRTGGYQEWTNHRDALELAKDIFSNADDVYALSSEEPGSPGFSDRMSLWFNLRYLVLAKKVIASAEKGDLDQQEAAMHRIGRELTNIRRADHSAARIHLQRERLEFQKTRAGEAKEAREAKTKPAKPRGHPGLSTPEKVHRVRQALFGENVDPSPGYQQTESYKKEQEKKGQAASSPVKPVQSNSDAPKAQTPSPSEPQTRKPEPSPNDQSEPPQLGTTSSIQQAPPPTSGGVLGDQHDPSRNTARDRNSVDFTDPYGIRGSASSRRGSCY